MSSKTEFRVEFIISSLNLYHQLVQTEAALFTCCISLGLCWKIRGRKLVRKFGLIKLGTNFSPAK